MPAQSPPRTLAKLRAKRRALLAQIENLDQIRRGSITEQFVEVVLKDGSKVRRGPYVLYSYKDKGARTVSRRLHDPQQIAHYRRQIEAFRQFQQCTADLLALGEALSDLALEDTEAEKKNDECRLEEQTEIQRLMGALRAERARGQIDLEAWEEAIASAVLSAGARLLEGLLQESGCGRRKDPVLAPDGRPMHSIGVRPKNLATVLGPVQLRRSVFYDESGQHSRIPLDESLGVQATAFSPGVPRLMARAGSRTSFEDASEDLCVYARLQLTPKQIQRVAEETGRRIEDWSCAEAAKAQPVQGPLRLASPNPPATLYVSFDGTGIPVRKVELAHSKGRAADGSARTREVKLGCVFTQTTLDEKGRPIRDPDSTTYVGASESSALFGLRIYQEAVRRGALEARRLIVLTDGARYNKSIATMHFPGATHIIDLFHAREHLHEIGRGLALDPVLLEHWVGLLDMGRIADLLTGARAELAQRRLSAPETKNWEAKLGYFKDNAAAMRYGDFRKMGCFVGSGVVEAGCRTVIGQRLKHSGMFWSVRGANAIIASRCCQLSRRFEDFWAASA